MADHIKPIHEWYHKGRHYRIARDSEGFTIQEYWDPKKGIPDDVYTLQGRNWITRTGSVYERPTVSAVIDLLGTLLETLPQGSD